MDFSLKDLRAFAVRNRVDVIFHARGTGAAWMVNRRGLVARPPIGDATLGGVEETLAAADEFLVDGEQTARQTLTRGQFVDVMAARAAHAGASKEKDEE